jgi:hypothetical protein
VRSNSPPAAMVALATTALLLLFSAPVAIADKDYSQNGATGDYARGPLPPPAPAKDYSQNAATGDYSRSWRAEAPGEPVSAFPKQVVTAAKPGDVFSWDDAAIGAGVGLVLALVACGATVALARRRIASPATGGLARLTRSAAEQRRKS